MRGVFFFLALGGVLACALCVAPADAADGGMQALAREKAAAAAILKHKAANEIATMANDRVFVAYLNSSTQGQGARLRARMAAMFSTVWNRFGVHEIALVDRAGQLIVRVGAPPHSPVTFDVAKDPVLAAGFARNTSGAVMIAGRDTLSYAAPVVWREQAEYVLSARQDFAAYRKVLSRGVGAGRFVLMLSNSGAILADTRDAAVVEPRGGLVAGLSLAALKRAVKGTADQGAGEIVRGTETYRLGYQTMDTWIIVAVESVSPPRRCPGEGARLCG